MHAIRMLLEGVVDYAGLFPPAKLDMAPAVRNYDAYRRGPDVWLLGRLVLPVSRFSEFEAAAEALMPRVTERPGGRPSDDDAWPITALTAPVADPQFAKDLDLIASFNERHARPGASSALVDVIEARAATADEIDAAIDCLPDDLFPYFELPGEADPRGLVAALAGLDVGAKIRTGGLTADAHPSVERVAAFIMACAAAEVPFKATAGLHHPLRHLAADPGCRQHGFLNVFLGACLAWHDKIDEARLGELLADEALRDFRFADDGAGWRDLRATVGQLRSARDEFAHAFGSCSFDEPLADLRGLHLLSPETAAR
ncbi:MAG: hypothetical protein U0572_11000 [Phycisphaerales bacterium]